jgi:P27 family predicted phage terminase small subunit
MTSGRRKMPTRLRVVSRNANPHEPEPEAVSRLPACPKYLTGYAREEWSRAGRELVSVGILTDLDLGLLAAWCQTFKTWRGCVEAMNTLEVQDPATRGLIVRSPSGAAYQNPILGTMNSAAREMRRLAQELGLSPSGRAGIAVSPISKPSAELIEKYGL